MNRPRLLGRVVLVWLALLLSAAPADAAGLRKITFGYSSIGSMATGVWTAKEAGALSGMVQTALQGSQRVIQGEKAGLNVVVAAADVIESIAFSGLSTTLRKVKENPEQARRVLRASLKGLRYVWENKTGTVDVIESLVQA